MWKLGLRPLSLISGNTYFWEYLFRVFGIVSLQYGGARPPSFTLSTASTRVTSLPPPPPQQNQRKGYYILPRRQSREYEADSGRNPDKSLKSFPPCYSLSLLQFCLEISISSNSLNLLQFVLFSYCTL
jgi:hypothetical protein